jgi:hypothetical protein
MNYQKHMEFFFLSLICGLATLGVSFISKMSENISQMTVSVKELNVRMESITDRLSRFDKEIEDHELRLRVIEQKRR